MKYQINIVHLRDEDFDVTLHNLEVEADPHTLCSMVLLRSRLRDNVESFVDQLAIVLGRENCEIEWSH